MDFKDNLVLLRKEQGLSQREAAERMGISQALLSHYEKGIREPKLDFVNRICAFYNVSADVLLGRAERSEVAGGVLPELSAETAVQLLSALQTAVDAKDKKRQNALSDYVSAGLYELFSALALTEPSAEAKPAETVALCELIRRQSQLVLTDGIEENGLPDEAAAEWLRETEKALIRFRERESKQ